VLDALAAQVGAEALRAQATAAEGYRGAAAREIEPIWDVPRGASGAPLHEARCEGYPHLVISDAPAALREAMSTWEGAEALTRVGLGARFPVLGAMTYDELHAVDACLGCRVLEDPADPRVHAPESAARLGLYVFAHVDDDPAAPYRRVASPSTAADLGDLEPVVVALAALVRLPLELERESTIAVARGY